ncbi:TetR/AcrR family transcriptional regulator [Actinokineospora bangkokensis]|uniref:TetR/AcrR family transcriptional regulator n=1 Tax=Actinokineospora bangkokensis TaxID=1193682 RepID=UPI000A4CEEC2|nr:TetR/AcrR family transcriptional regulator [Actinokineospora bangkokensis]
MGTQAEPLRRDARRNRELVLAAARRLMAERGLDVGYEEIARAAGVGMGTVYRRFPERTALIDALFNDHIDTLVGLAEQAGGCADPWHGLVGFMEQSLQLQEGDRGLSEVLRGHLHAARLSSSATERVAPVVQDLVDRARAAGALPDDVTPGDFALVHRMVSGVMDSAPGSPLWRRALHVALAGLRSGSPLPGPAPDHAAIDALQGGRSGE